MTNKALPIILPQPEQAGLSFAREIVDNTGTRQIISLITEKAITLFLNRQEIVSVMTIGDYPRYLALGYLHNQGLLRPGEIIEAVEYDSELEVIIVRTNRPTNYEEKLQKKIRTSGCAMGTMFGDVMEQLAHIRLTPVPESLPAHIIQNLARKIPQIPSLYLKAGSIHGCVLCQGETVLAYMEDVGRHNAVDKIAGFMKDHGLEGADTLLYTTGRLTSEMVIKAAIMGIPVLISRSGATEFGVRLAEETGITLISRAKGNRFLALSHAERIFWPKA